MLEHDRIDISEGIDIEKTNKSKPHLCNGCHGLLQKAVRFNNIAIVYVKGSAYRINFWHISKEDAIDMMNNSSLIDKMRVLCLRFMTSFL